MALASTAMRDLCPWDVEAAANRERALTLVRPLRDLVTGAVTDVRNAWWSAPLDRRAQLLLSGQDDPQRDPVHLQVPEGPSDAWEVYAQRPIAGITTSTELPVPPDEPIRSGATGIRRPTRAPMTACAMPLASTTAAPRVHHGPPHGPPPERGCPDQRSAAS